MYLKRQGKEYAPRKERKLGLKLVTIFDDYHGNISASLCDLDLAGCRSISGKGAGIFASPACFFLLENQAVRLQNRNIFFDGQ